MFLTKEAVRTDISSARPGSRIKIGDVIHALMHDATPLAVIDADDVNVRAASVWGASDDGSQTVRFESGGGGGV